MKKPRTTRTAKTEVKKTTVKNVASPKPSKAYLAALKAVANMGKK